MSFFDDDRLLASFATDGTLIIWRTDTWAEVSRTPIGSAGYWSNIAVHPTLPIVASPGSTLSYINIWQLDLDVLRVAGPAKPTANYVCAKAVLLGDSGVGKSGLGIRIAEQTFRKTESNHGAQFWHLSAEKLRSALPDLQRELTLWDMAGQPEYRLIHQLFLDDIDAALLLFDGGDSNDPFRGVRYWAKILKKHAPLHTLKILVAARSDVSPATADHREIKNILDECNLDNYFVTCAKTGEGVEALFDCLIKKIAWDELPRTSTPRLFHAVGTLLLQFTINSESCG